MVELYLHSHIVFMAHCLINYVQTTILTSLSYLTKITISKNSLPSGEKTELVGAAMML
jgi:hypothetical protein